MSRRATEFAVREDSRAALRRQNCIIVPNEAAMMTPSAAMTAKIGATMVSAMSSGATMMKAEPKTALILARKIARGDRRRGYEIRRVFTEDGEIGKDASELIRRHHEHLHKHHEGARVVAEMARRKQDLWQKIEDLHELL